MITKEGDSDTRESDEVPTALQLVANTALGDSSDWIRQIPRQLSDSPQKMDRWQPCCAPYSQLDLDSAGALLLCAHGSTTAAILAAAEASAAARTGDAIVIADDFGDELDAASGEYLAARLRRRSGQLWLTTGQAEVP